MTKDFEVDIQKGCLYVENSRGQWMPLHRLTSPQATTNDEYAALVRDQRTWEAFLNGR